MLFRFSAFLIALFCVSAAIGQKPVKKKNVRPEAEAKVEAETAAVNPPVFFYEYEQPEFVISKVLIEHDENGNGAITFSKKRLEEDFTLPMSLSPVTNSLLSAHWSNLNFLDLTDTLQSKREYPHLGTMRLRMSVGEKSRTSEFNWTDNPDAKALTDEYKKIGYQYVWIFDINVARRNHPLETPKIMKELDKYLVRGTISDPSNILPFLMELGDDERLPLIARNHAKRLVKRIGSENK